MFKQETIKICFFFLFICQRFDAVTQSSILSRLHKNKLRITGGSKVDNKEISRHVVSIRKGDVFNYYNHECGGAILTPKVVMTSAHCVVDSNNMLHNHIRVIAGTTVSQNFPDTARIYDANKIKVHPDYKYGGIVADLALIYTDFIQEDGINIEKVPLPIRDVVPNENCVVAGWGSTDAFQLVFPVELMFVNQSICPDEWDYPGKNRGVICAGNSKDWVKSVQRGDSGSPLICRGAVSGLVSFGTAMPLAKFYADIFYYRDWIQKNSAGANKTTSNSWLGCLLVFRLFFKVFGFEKKKYCKDNSI